MPRPRSYPDVTSPPYPPEKDFLITLGVVAEVVKLCPCPIAPFSNFNLVPPASVSLADTLIIATGIAIILPLFILRPQAFKK